MKKLWWRKLLVSLVLVALCTSLVGTNVVLADDSSYNSFGTGLKEPTAAELEWMEQNFPTIGKIHLNSLALERINAEREAKGLRKIIHY